MRDPGMRRVAEVPRIYGTYRRFPLQTFPFSIVYAVRRDFVEVIAVAHYRRKPGYWRVR